MAKRTWAEFWRAALADGLVALALSLVIGLILSSLAAAGVVAITSAIVQLIAAFGCVMFVALLLPTSPPKKAIGIMLAALLLAGMGYYENSHFEAPLSKNDITEAVRAAIPKDEKTNILPTTVAIQAAKTAPSKQAHIEPKGTVIGSATDSTVIKQGGKNNQINVQGFYACGMQHGVVQQGTGNSVSLKDSRIARDCPSGVEPGIRIGHLTVGPAKKVPNTPTSAPVEPVLPLPQQNCLTDVGEAHVGNADISNNTIVGPPNLSIYCNRGGTTDTLREDQNFIYQNNSAPK